MTIHVCDRCKKEAKGIESYMIPDFNAYGGVISNDTYEMYGRPIRPIELCPQCKKQLELLLNNFLEEEI